MISRCRFCGESLRPHRVQTTVPLAEQRADGYLVETVTKTEGYGYAGRGYFCSLRCGHAWAVRKLQEDR